MASERLGIIDGVQRLVWHRRIGRHGRWGERARGFGGERRRHAGVERVGGGGRPGGPRRVRLGGRAGRPGRIGVGGCA